MVLCADPSLLGLTRKPAIPTFAKRPTSAFGLRSSVMPGHMQPPLQRGGDHNAALAFTGSGGVQAALHHPTPPAQAAAAEGKSSYAPKVRPSSAAATVTVSAARPFTPRTTYAQWMDAIDAKHAETARQTNLALSMRASAAATNGAVGAAAF